MICQEQIREMLIGYITNPNVIILAVTPANQDFATSEPLKMARDVDSDGELSCEIVSNLERK